MAITGPDKNQKQAVPLASTWQDRTASFKPRAKAKKQKYTVKAGDNFLNLSRKLFGDEARANELANMNPGVNRLVPGMVVTLPPKVDAMPPQVPAGPPQVQVQAPSWATPDYQQRAAERNQAPVPQTPPGYPEVPFAPVTAFLNAPAGPLVNTATKGFGKAPQPPPNQVTGRSVLPGAVPLPPKGASVYQMPRQQTGGARFETNVQYRPANTTPVPGANFEQPWWAGQGSLPGPVQASWKPTMLPDTFLASLPRTSEATAAQLAAGVYPLTISSADAYYLKLSDEDLLANGYVKAPHGGWKRQDAAMTQGGYRADDGGSGGRSRGGGGRGGGGGFGLQPVYQGYRPYAGGGGDYSPQSFGLVSWRI